MSRNKTVGILGGMGPAATANFLRLFVAELNRRGAVEDSDFPRMVMLSLPLADWDNTGTLDDESVASQVAEGVEWLRRAGAAPIAIPCNTVHEFRERYITRGAEVLDIIGETLARIDDEEFGVICSRTTRRAGLYERDGRRVVYPENQAAVDDIVAEVIAGREVDLRVPMADLVNRDIKTVALGCTELSVCKVGMYLPRHLVDSAAALAEALADRV